MSNQISEDLREWFASRPLWIQTAACYRLQTGDLTSDQYTLLEKLCRMEAGEQSMVGQFASLPLGAFGTESEADGFRLESITDIVGVNALKPKSPLSFSGQLTIVYGGNGSGKSGYARLLAHACGSRFCGTLHCDAFESDPPAAAATFILSKDGSPIPLTWGGIGTSIAELRRVHIFDSDCALSYIGKPNEAAFEPFLVRLLTVLVGDCVRVQRSIEATKFGHVSRLPKLPIELSVGKDSVWFETLSANTSTAEVESHCSFTDDDAHELLSLENVLGQTDAASSLEDVRRRQGRATSLKRQLEGLRENLSASTGRAIRVLHNDARTAREEASASAAILFGASPLPGVGEAPWRSMWEAAREYSERSAYPGRPFPVTDQDAVCPLCQQPLAGGAERFRVFQQFIQASLETKAVAAQQALTEAVGNVPVIPSIEDLTNRFEAAGLFSIDIPELHQGLDERKRWIVSDNTEIAHNLGWEHVLEELTRLTGAYSSTISGLVELETSSEQAKKRAIAQDLKVRRWLSQQRTAIEEEISRLSFVAQLDKAIQLTNTTALTRKKNDLSETLQATAYRERFLNELETLGAGRIPIEIVPSRADREGKPGFAIALRGATRDLPACEVLSEGESRIVALASFLADVTANTVSVPLVFDDPISSLDQEFEEKAVKRLAIEAASRQVIVFTHRLSLLSMLEGASEANGLTCEIVALHSFGATRGTPGETSIQEKNPLGALKRLANDRLPKARRAEAAQDAEDAEVYKKSLCTDIRILLERTIEKVLLNEVVERFRRPIITKDKLAKLALLTAEDCSLFDRLMTEYSFAEHSQPQESPVPLPTLDKIAGDLQQLITWIEAFKRRD